MVIEGSVILYLDGYDNSMTGHLHIDGGSVILYLDGYDNSEQEACRLRLGSVILYLDGYDNWAGVCRIHAQGFSHPLFGWLR